MLYLIGAETTSVAIHEQRSLKRYEENGTRIKVFWASTVLKLTDIENIPASHQHRIVMGQRGNQAYLFHLMFIVLDNLVADLQLGIAADICIEPRGISWHNGSRWKRWQQTHPVASLPQHPILGEEHKLGFKLTHLCIVYSPDVSIRGFRAHFNQTTVQRMPELQPYRQQIDDNARAQQILTVPYITLDISDISYLVTFLLSLYSHTLPQAPPLLAENELPRPIVIRPQRSVVRKTVYDDDLELMVLFTRARLVPSRLLLRQVCRHRKVRRHHRGYRQLRPRTVPHHLDPQQLPLLLRKEHLRINRRLRITPLLVQHRIAHLLLPFRMARLYISVQIARLYLQLRASERHPCRQLVLC